MTNLLINTDNTQDVSIMKVTGRVDSESAPELDSALTDLLNNNRSKIVLDLQAVDYLSSAGLRALVKALKNAKTAGGDLHLASVSEPIEIVLRTVGMLQLFEMYPSHQEAILGF